jgi:hypothetical protein
LESDGVEVVENDLFQLLVNLLLFPQYNVPLPFDGRRVKFGVLEDITDNVDSLGDILFEALGVIDSLFPRRVSVEVCTNVLNLELQSVLGTTAGTLEGHVLEEVSGSVGGIVLCPGTSIYPDTDCSGLSMGVGLCSDGKAIRKGSCLGDGGEVGSCRESPQRSPL